MSQPPVRHGAERCLAQAGVGCPEALGVPWTASPGVSTLDSASAPPSPQAHPHLQDCPGAVPTPRPAMKTSPVSVPPTLGIWRLALGAHRGHRGSLNPSSGWVSPLWEQSSGQSPHSGLLAPGHGPEFDQCTTDHLSGGRPLAEALSPSIVGPLGTSRAMWSVPGAGQDPLTHQGPPKLLPCPLPASRLSCGPPPSSGEGPQIGRTTPASGPCPEPAAFSRGIV